MINRTTTTNARQNHTRYVFITTGNTFNNRKNEATTSTRRMICETSIEIFAIIITFGNPNIESKEVNSTDMSFVNAKPF
jgi:hypothetical protein